MNEKLSKIVKGPIASAVADGVKNAAINMVAVLVLKGVYELGKKVITVAADAVLGNSEKVA